MSVDVLFPKIGFSMTEGTLLEWLAANGAQVEAGQPLYTMEGDKAVEEISAPAAGTLEIVEPAGEVVAVGTLLARIR